MTVKGGVPWNRGLTSDPKSPNYDSRVGKPLSWNKGKTKETDERLASYGKKISATQKGRRFSDERKRKHSEATSRQWVHIKEDPVRYQAMCEAIRTGTERSDKAPWNKGLTKETDERVARNALKITGRKQSTETRIKQSLGVRLFHAKKNMLKVMKFYKFDAPLLVPVEHIKEHKFARYVLIEKRKGWKYIERTGLMERPVFLNKFPPLQASMYIDSKHSL